MTLSPYTLAPGEEWTGIAARWPVTYVSRETDPGHHWTEVTHLGAPPATQAHLACGECGQSVTCLSPDVTRGAYTLNDETIRAGILRHIRQCHEDPAPTPRVLAL
jgi:hypothetical protein